MPCGPCMKRDTSSPLSLKLRTYACTVGDDLFRRRFRRVVGHSPAFNGSFLVQETPRMNRIGGMDQHGDVVVRHDYLKEGWTVRVEYRAGDEGLVEALERELARELTPCPNLPSPIKSRPPGMAYFFEMVQGQPLGRKVLIADSAIESAHSTGFAAYRETRLELELLTRLHTLRHTHLRESEDLQERYRRAMERHDHAKFCLFEGRKVCLPHRIKARGPKNGNVLVMHFALLPGGKPLVGWVEERAF